MDANFLSPNVLLVQSCTVADIEKMISRVIDVKLANMQPVPPVADGSNNNTLYRRKEAADLLGVSLVTLSTWTKAGFIKSRKIGARIYYTKKNIDEALKVVNG